MPPKAPPAAVDAVAVWMIVPQERITATCTCGPKGGGRGGCPVRNTPNALHRGSMMLVPKAPGGDVGDPDVVVDPLIDGRSDEAKAASEVARLQALERGGLAASSTQAAARAMAEIAITAYKKNVEKARACTGSRDSVFETDGVCAICELGVEFAKHHRQVRVSVQVSDGDPSPPHSKARTDAPATTTAGVHFAAGPLGATETVEALLRARLDSWKSMWSDGHERTSAAWGYLRAASFGECAKVMWSGVVVPKTLPTLSTTFAFAPFLTEIGKSATMEDAIAMARATFRTRLILGSRAMRDIIIGWCARRRADASGSPEKYVHVLADAAQVKAFIAART